MSRRGLTLVLAAVATIALLALAAFLPVPYVILVPGPVTDTLGNLGTGPVISVTGARTFPTQGHLYLTTVGVVPGSCGAHPSLLQALEAWFNSEHAVQPHQVICPPGESGQAVQQQNEQAMTQSQQDAVTAALLQLGYRPTSRQIIVGDIEPNSPAAAVLQQGDAILSVNGAAVTDAATLRRLISAHPPGTTLTLVISRAGRTRTVQVRTIRAGDGTNRAIIGITPDLRATFTGVHVRIGIDPTQVGGPSAGLAFTLGIIDKLTPGGLTGGRTVAGTGTIDGFGDVGPIGGIQQKIFGALHAGATVFLVPAGDCADARAVAPKSLTLVRVDRLATAIAALKAIDSGSTAFPRC